MSQLVELETQAEAGGISGTVSTSSVQRELSFLGIDLANPATGSQIAVAITQVQSEQTALSARNNQLENLLQEFAAFG